MCPYFAPFVRYSQILVERHRFNLPHLYLAQPSGWPRWNFAEIFGIRKPEGLPFRML